MALNHTIGNDSISHLNADTKLLIQKVLSVVGTKLRPLYVTTNALNHLKRNLIYLLTLDDSEDSLFLPKGELKVNHRVHIIHRWN